MLIGCLGGICIHMVPCSGRETLTTPWGPWAGSKDEAGVGWGALSGIRALVDHSQLSHLCQTLLLEKLRVARRPANEATFNVFYYLLACSDSTLR